MSKLNVTLVMNLGRFCAVRTKMKKHVNWAISIHIYIFYQLDIDELTLCRFWLEHVDKKIILFSL